MEREFSADEAQCQNPKNEKFKHQYIYALCDTTRQEVCKPLLIFPSGHVSNTERMIYYTCHQEIYERRQNLRIICQRYWQGVWPDHFRDNNTLHFQVSKVIAISKKSCGSNLSFASVCFWFAAQMWFIIGNPKWVLITFVIRWIFDALWFVLFWCACFFARIQSIKSHVQLEIRWSVLQRCVHCFKKASEHQVSHIYGSVVSYSAATENSWKVSHSGSNAVLFLCLYTGKTNVKLRNTFRISTSDDLP